MYTVDHLDQVIPLEGLPQSSVGAPMPVLFADESMVIIAYILQNSELSQNAEDYAFVKFSGCKAHLLGPPNDEAFEGHPLASRGLEPYSAFRIENSSWLRQLERMNSVHPMHKPEHFARYRHYVLTFHDSVFECIAQSFSLSIQTASRQSLLIEFALLWQEFEGPIHLRNR